MYSSVGSRLFHFVWRSALEKTQSRAAERLQHRAPESLQNAWWTVSLEWPCMNLPAMFCASIALSVPCQTLDNTQLMKQHQKNITRKHQDAHSSPWCHRMNQDNENNENQWKKHEKLETQEALGCPDFATRSQDPPGPPKIQQTTKTNEKTTKP